MAGIGIVIALMIMILIAKATPSSTTPRGYSALLDNGIPGRGILLAVSSTSVGESVGIGMYKFQQRAVTIDIEVPGRPAYEATVTVLVPLNLVRDVLPGATMEVRVDPRNSNNIAIVGPGVGFNASTLMTQGQITQGAA